MKHLQTLGLVLGLIAGLACATAGFYRLAGLDWTLLVGGLALGAVCFTVDA